MNRLVLLLLLCLATVGGPGPASAWSDWLTLKTDYFTVFCKPGYEAQARRTLEHLEQHRPFVEELTGNRALALPVVVEDMGMSADGFADPIAGNIHLSATPPPAMAATEDWIRLVGVHEYIHALATTKVTGPPALLRAVLGPVVAPNLIAPAWMAEGLAVYGESQLSTTSGRLNEGTFDATVAAMAREGRLPSIAKATSYPDTEFPPAAAYVFGGAFTRYLAEALGREKLAAFLAEEGSAAGALPSLVLPWAGLDSSAKRVYGKRFGALWEDWRAYEAERARDYAMEGERLTRRGWVVECPRVDGGNLYYRHTYPRKAGALRTWLYREIVERDLRTGAERVVLSTTAPFLGAVRVRGGKLLYAVAESRKGFANATRLTFGDQTALHERDLATKADRVVARGRIRGFDRLPDGAILYASDRADGAGSRLFRLAPGASEPALLFDADHLVDEIAAEGPRIFAVARKPWRNTGIYALSIEERSLTPLVDTPYVEAGLCPAGDRLLFAANYGGRYSLYCRRLEDGRVERLTHEGYAHWPAYDASAGMLFFVGLTAEGHDLYRVAAAPVPFTLPDAEPVPKPTNAIPDRRIARGGYGDNLKTLAPKVRYPYAYRDETRRLLGVGLTGAGINGTNDAVGDFPYYGTILAYDTRQGKPRFAAGLMANYFAPLQLSASYSGLSERSVWINLNYPAVWGYGPGLSSLAVGVSLDYHGEASRSYFTYRPTGFARRAVTPYLTAGFLRPGTSMGASVQVPFEGMRFGRPGLDAALLVRRAVGKGEVSARARSIQGGGNPDVLFSDVRGYPDALIARRGTELTLEVSRPLARVRSGLWNPSFFFEDICGTLFLDAAMPTHGRQQVAYGMDIHVETSLFFSLLRIDPGIRIVRTREGDTSVGAFLTSSGSIRF